MHLASASDYADVESQLLGFLSVDEPPVQKIDEMWTLTAPVDAFELAARRLTTSYLERCKHAFREVFGRINLKVETPPDEWLYHDIKGEQGHSGWLRSGMAETLLLIAERGVDARLLCVSSPQAYVEDVVRGIPSLNDDWRILASLCNQYARLMEAAPRPFLASLEHLLEAHPDDICRLFVEGGALGSRSMHTGLLWGLETLAWSAEYLPQVALILAKLARLDPGGRLVHRPINSLRESFLWWHLGTQANIDQRLGALDRILEREPQVGWALLAKLLPRATSSISHPTAKPQWRDFGDPPADASNRRSQLTYASAIVDRALERVGTDPEQWCAVLNSLRVFNVTQREKVLALLHKIAKASPAAEVKAPLWEVVRDFISRHRAFSNAGWSLPAGTLDQLEAILGQMAPDDPIERSRWRIEEWLPPVASGGEHLAHRKQMVEELRREAVQEILAKEGISGLVKLHRTIRHWYTRIAAIPTQPGFRRILWSSSPGD